MDIRVQQSPLAMGQEQRMGRMRYVRSVGLSQLHGTLKSYILRFDPDIPFGWQNTSEGCSVSFKEPIHSGAQVSYHLAVLAIEDSLRKRYNQNACRGRGCR